MYDYIDNIDELDFTDEYNDPWWRQNEQELASFDTPAERTEYQYQGGHEEYNYNQ